MSLRNRGGGSFFAKFRLTPFLSTAIQCCYGQFPFSLFAKQNPTAGEQEEAFGEPYLAGPRLRHYRWCPDNTRGFGGVRFPLFLLFFFV